MFIFLMTIFVLIVTLALWKWKQVNKKVLESFSEIEKKTMSRFSRFSEIIKGFEKEKEKKPSPNELNAFYDEFFDRESYSGDDVAEVLKDEGKYHEIMSKFMNGNNLEKDEEVESVEAQTKKSNAIADEIDEEQALKLIKRVYQRVFAGEDLSSDNKEFLMYKFTKLEYDTKRLEEYLTSNEDYLQFIKKKIDGQFLRDSAGPSDSTLLMPSTKSFKISRPHVNNTTLEEISDETNLSVDGYSCKDLEDEHVLSKIMNSRNMDLLKYACLRSKDKHKRTDNDMVLIKGLDWSVPQERPGVCRTNKRPADVASSTDQTSLIGTLLESAASTQVGSIMPEFNFEEKEN